MPLFSARFLDRLGAGEGIAVMALVALSTLAGLLGVGKLTGAEFISGFSMWAGTFFGGSALAAFRDVGKPKVVLPATETK